MNILDDNFCIFVRSFFSHFGSYIIATWKCICTALRAKVQNYQIVIEIIYKTCSFFLLQKREHYAMFTTSWICKFLWDLKTITGELLGNFKCFTQNGNNAS